MSSPSQPYKARSSNFFTSRLILLALCAFVTRIAQVHGQAGFGQAGCTTYPCSVSIAIYSVSPEPGSPAQSTTSLKALDPPSSSSITTSPSSTITARSSSLTLNILTISGPAPSVFDPAFPTPDSKTKEPPTTVPASVLPTESSKPQSPSSISSTATSTRIPLPTFSTRSTVPPLITQGPKQNDTSANSTSSTQCGACSVMADQVQVYYWPTASVKTNCARAASASQYQSSLKSFANATTNATPSLTALASAGSTDVINGFTYTFPSTYVSVVGKIQVSNSCGALGKTHANPTPVAVQAITTASYASWPSNCRPQGNYVDAVIDTLDIADIACPTWGLSDPFYTTCDGSSYLTATAGPPYNPVILVPTEFLGYDPLWGKCTEIPINGPFLLPCGVYDPPRALHTESSLSPPETSPSDPSAPTPVSAEPAFTPAPNVAQSTAAPQPHLQITQIPEPPIQEPSNTGQNGQGSGNQGEGTPGGASSGSGNTGSSSLGSSDPGTSNPQSNNSPPSQPNSNQGTGAGSSNSNEGSSNQPANKQAPSSPNSPNSPPAPQPIPQTTINLVEQPTGGIGSIINNGFGGSGPPTPSQAGSGAQGGNSGATGGGGTSDSSSGSSQGGAGQGNTESPSGGSVGGNLGGAQGGSPNQNAGGGAAINPGSQPGNSPAFTPHAITALGVTLSALNPTAVAIGGKTLSVGGPAFTSNRKYYSLGSSGNLVAGTLATGATPTPAAMTFAGQSITANSAGQFVIDGQTLAPGKMITVSGTPISEGSGGAFAVVGSNTQSFANTVPSQGPALLTFGGSTYTANAVSQFVIGGQTLTAGGQITVSGTALSEASSGSAVVIGGSSTQSLAHDGASAAMVTSVALMTFGGQTYTADAQGDFTIGGQTLTPGGMITVAGTPISEATGATDVVIGSSTETLGTAAVTQSAMSFEGFGRRLTPPFWGGLVTTILLLVGGLPWLLG